MLFIYRKALNYSRHYTIFVSASTFLLDGNVFETDSWWFENGVMVDIYIPLSDVTLQNGWKWSRSPNGPQ